MSSGSTRQDLVDSTRALLWERGYAATSPRAILARAGAGQGSMYHHFAGKEALAVVAFEAGADAVVARAAQVLQGPGVAVDRLESYLLLHRDVLRGCPVGRMAADAEVLDSPALRTVLADAFGRITAMAVAVVEQAIVDGDLSDDTDPAELVATMLAVVQGGYVLARAADDPRDFDRAVRGAVALLRAARP